MQTAVSDHTIVTQFGKPTIQPNRFDNLTLFSAFAPKRQQSLFTRPQVTNSIDREMIIDITQRHKDQTHRNSRRLSEEKKATHSTHKSRNQN